MVLGRLEGPKFSTKKKTENSRDSYSIAEKKKIFKDSSEFLKAR